MTTSPIHKAITLLLHNKPTEFASDGAHRDEHIWIINAVALLLRVEQDRQKDR